MPRKWWFMDENGIRSVICFGYAPAEILIFSTMTARKLHIEAADIEEQLALAPKKASIRAMPGMPGVYSGFA
jgi:hypothetical protein